MNASCADHDQQAANEMNGLISLSPAEIHLWLASYDEIEDERLHAAYRELLSAEEKVQEPRFYFARDRRRYLVTRALVRTVLSRYMDIPPAEWSFANNAYGRPEIANAGARDAGFSFNISHTHGLIVLGVARQRALGIDVENVHARKIPLDVADHYFAPAEVAALNAAPTACQQYRFFEYWTFKESYIKARGMGLSLPLDKFSFHYPDDHAVEIAIDSELADDPGRWQFWQFRPAPEFLAAVCARGIGGQSTSFNIRRVVPLHSEREVSLEATRVPV